MEGGESHWERDDEVSQCRGCGTAFSIIRRKHHCRLDGRIYCDDCTPLRAVLSSSSPSPVRVCLVCYLRLHPRPAPPLHFVILAPSLPSFLSFDGFRFSLVAGGKVVRSIHIFSIVSIRVTGFRITITLDHPEPGTVVLVSLEPEQLVEAYKTAISQLDFIDTYRAWCDFFYTPPDPTLLQEVVDSVRSGNRALDLTQLPGAQSLNLALDLRPVARALKNDTYFTSLIVHALHRKDAIGEMVQVFESNVALAAVRFSGMQNCSGLERLGSLLTQNPKARLCSIDLSGTPLSTSVAQSLASCLPRMTHLVLAHCSLDDRELCLLIPNLNGSVLVLLNLSGNRFAPKSSELLAQQISICTVLERLILVDCSLRVEALFDPKNATLSALSGLIELDISGNSMRNFGGPFALQAVSLIAMFSRLQEFGMHDTQADAIQVVVPMLSLMLTNSNISVSFNVSGCHFGGPKAAAELQKGLRTAVSHSLRALDLSRIQVTPLALRDILLALIPSEQLDTLSVNFALAAPASLKEGKVLAKMFGTLCAQKPRLQTLRCAGLGQSVVLPLMQELTLNTSLKELDISSNQLQDVGATVIGLFLRLNHSLIALELDENQISLPGFLALRSALVAVGSQGQLCYMSFPWKDYDRSSDKEQVRKILLEIRDLLTRNQKLDSALQERFARYRPGATLNDVFVPSSLPPIVPERDDHGLVLEIETSPEEPPPLPCPVDQPEDIVVQPKTISAALRTFQREHAQKLSVGLGERVHIQSQSYGGEEGEAQSIGNTLWENLNQRRRVMELSSDED